MDSQLASVLTSGSLDVQNGSQCAEGSGSVKEAFVGPQEKSSLGTAPGNLQPCPVTAAGTIIRQDAASLNGKQPEVGGDSKPASQETSKIGGFRQPITVKTGVPVLRSQPITIKIVVPPRCKKPITNSAISLTKEFPLSHARRPVSVSSEKRSQMKASAVTNEGELKEVIPQKSEEPEAESFHATGAERGNTLYNQNCVLEAELINSMQSDTALISSMNTVKLLRGVIEDATERDTETNVPVLFKEMDLETCKLFAEVDMVEQMEPLDLSLPKKREAHESRCGHVLHDSGCETSLIMEVDEYEGDGDRDIVEEDVDNEGDECVLHAGGTDALEDSLLSPSFFSTSVFTSLSSIKYDTEDVLLIDDQGIPYTLSPDGLKVPQVDASTSADPQSDQANSAEVEEKGLLQLEDRSLSQSSNNALNAPSDICPLLTPDTESPSQLVDRTKPPEVFSSIINSDPSKATEPNVKAVQEVNAALSSSSGTSVPNQAIQILTNPSTNAPILLLSSPSSTPQLSSAPLGLSLTQTSPGASTPMFLLLSATPSSSSDPSASTATPIAVLDPSTGQLSQITAASTSISLSSSSGQVSSLGSPLSTLPHPVIRLSANDSPVVLSGVNGINPGSLLTSLAVPLSTPAVQSDHHSMSPALHAHVSSSDSNPGSEAISAQKVSNENDKPLTFAESSAHAQPANFTYDPMTQPSSEADVQSPASESVTDSCVLPSEHLPLDDHLYFSNMAAPPSPPIAPIIPSGKLDPLNPLDPPSPNAMGSRRVLYCQLCPRVFFYLSDLERHAITHSQKKPHVCQQCGKAFKRSSHLQRHKHIHTGQRNFVCPICAKRFREAGELQRHQRVHTGEKPYQCQLCHTRFAERNTLRRHTKRKHPYHQVAMEMLNERKDRGGGVGGGVSQVQEEEDSAEWYSSTVSNLDNSESEMET
ncbi:hypothetical protein JOB18_024652 [Solea senegalensis]|uniref:Zinc finger protein 524 n=1 Tax=Solea senegalensis TaxID=28829 RepID=A0AAV6PRE8_SOLSE|nr:mucin-17 [Solea senegalensis]XP_043889140.1 mucin-17 [Solea senegalensis]KAG7475134.1 zinc finger protein 524 [Solea senegalensis]KAG7475135.1 hypothetical protein JOB18_024652 [Solea senegalensis]KAG7475136.1 hypothetical protein JOB18_024652 [Solea senegalensis]